MMNNESGELEVCAIRIGVLCCSRNAGIRACMARIAHPQCASRLPVSPFDAAAGHWRAVRFVASAEGEFYDSEGEGETLAACRRRRESSAPRSPSPELERESQLEGIRRPGWRGWVCSGTADVRAPRRAARA